MVGFTFSAEQIRSAPPEVRRWIEEQITRTLGLPITGVHDGAETHSGGIAVCSLEEAAAILQRIQEDYLACQVFLELGREGGSGVSYPPELHAIGIADILRHTRIGEGSRLAACFQAINAALQEIRGDPQATLFAFDQRGTCYVHEATHRNIRQLWQDFVAAHKQAAAGDPRPQASGLPRISIPPLSVYPGAFAPPYRSGTGQTPTE
jgi:hypothetical protein